MSPAVRVCREHRDQALNEAGDDLICSQCGAVDEWLVQDGRAPLEGGREEKSPSERIREIVSARLKETSNNRARALRLAVADVMRSALVEEIVEAAVREGIDRVLHEQYKNQRRTAIHQTLSRVDGVARTARTRLREAVAGLSAFPLPNGLLLHAAEKPDVVDAAMHWITQGRTMLERGLWLRFIADRLPDDKRVGDVFGDDELRRLFDLARRQANEPSK